MMEFILIPTVVGITFYGTYKLFELFVRRKERLLFIDKAINSSDNKEDLILLPDFTKRNPYSTLKIACLLIGVGLGLLIGFFINLAFNESTIDASLFVLRKIKELHGIVYGASIFIFGGAGLLTAFIFEMKYSKNKE